MNNIPPEPPKVFTGTTTGSNKPEKTYSEISTGVYLEKGAEQPPTSIMGFATSLYGRLNSEIYKGAAEGKIRIYVESGKTPGKGNIGPVPLPQVTAPSTNPFLVPEPQVTAPSTNPFIVPLPQKVVGAKPEWRVRVVSTAGNLDVDGVRQAAKSRADFAGIKCKLESEKPTTLVFNVKPSKTEESAQATMDEITKAMTETGAKQFSNEMKAEIEAMKNRIKE